MALRFGSASARARRGSHCGCWCTRAIPGLAWPASAFPVGHKAGWLPNIQHDAALVFTPHGTLVAVFMNYSAGGVSYARVRDAAGVVVRLALRRGG